MSDVTQLLLQIDEGDTRAASELLPLVYEELRKLAAAKMMSERDDHTLQPTALVHEAFLRLVGSQDGSHWNSRGHFFGAAAEAMRRLLVENARRKGRMRHGGDHERVPLDLIHLPHIDQGKKLLELDEALKILEQEDPASCAVVKLRYFTGLTIEQTAAVLGISVRTANRNWVYAKARLFQELAN
jgi:RNA polymerase sigma factor (TIGR02999 family)